MDASVIPEKQIDRGLGYQSKKLDIPSHQNLVVCRRETN
jgi:hypothetical protein